MSAGVPDSSISPGRRSCTLAGWGLLAIFVLTTAALADKEENIRLFQAAYAVGFVGYLLLILHVQRGSPIGRWTYWLTGCILLRIPLVPTTPSDDVYRYLWEGRIQLAGHNPFTTPPDDSALSDLRDDNWRHINHRDFTTIYPPLAQLEFRLLAALTPTSLRSFKIAHVVLDVLATCLLAAWLKKLGRPPHAAVIYALCPLTLTAFAIEGHVDSLMLACLAAVGLAWTHRRHYWAAVFLAAAILAKTVPILLLPWLARRNFRAAVLAAVLWAAGYFPFASAGLDLLNGLIRFAGTTELLSFGHALLGGFLDGPALTGATAVVMAGVVVWHLWRRIEFESYARPVLGGLILLAPVVHFWYLTWLLLFLSLALRWSWFVLAAAMLFYFEAAGQRHLTGDWNMPAWVSYAVWTPFVVAWVLACLASAFRAEGVTADRGY